MRPDRRHEIRQTGSVRKGENMLLEIRDGTVSLGGIPVLSHFSFGIKGTEKIAVVGRNGAGKTTLLRLIAGEILPDRDDRNPGAGIRKSRAFTVGMLGQTAVTDPEKTIRDAVMDDVMAGKPAEFRYSEERYAYEQRYDRMFTGFGFRKEDKQKKMGDFSGGEQTKISLIRLLLAEPDILILDEPTNHLDLASVEWLEECVRSYPKAVVAVSHDRYFIDRTADVIWEVEYGKTTRYSGNYTEYRAQKAAAYDKQLKAYERQQDEIRRLNELIEKFRHKPNKAAFARSRKKILERMPEAKKPVKDTAVIRTEEIVPARTGSKWVFECEHLKFGYDRALAEISFRIRRGMKIGILGPNGSGKSTFLKTVTGRIPALGGQKRTGVNVDAAYFDQMSAAWDNGEKERTVIDWYHDRFPQKTMKDLRDTLAGWLFDGGDMGKKIRDLSGGERARLVLAALLEEKPNFLVLDEPTNNMDIPAKETLESILRCYRGTILFVSHDRYFLSKVADALLIFEPGNEVMFYPFGYAHYMEKKRTADKDAAALRTAEEQRMIEELKAVPKGERPRLREMSTAEAQKDWQFMLNRREWTDAVDMLDNALKYVDNALHDVDTPITPEVYLEAGGLWDRIRGEAETAVREAERHVTKAAVEWYELWLDTLPDEEAEHGETEGGENTQEKEDRTQQEADVPMGEMRSARQEEAAASGEKTGAAEKETERKEEQQDDGK